MIDYRWIVLYFGLLSLGCKHVPGMSKGTKDPIVAKVEDKTLLQSQLKELTHEGISKTDSAAIIDGYIQNWVRENLMIKEAEKNVSADLDINKLVDDYRSSLLVYNYEKMLVATKLDTIVTDEDKADFYEKNKGQYLLSHPIFKCIIVKIPSKSSSAGTIKTKLEKNDWSDLISLVKAKSSTNNVDTAIYWTLDDIHPFVPEGMITASKLGAGKVLFKKEKDFDYLVKIIRYYKENTIPPMDFIESKIIKWILSERKIQLLNNYREDLYNKGVKDNKFEIYKLES